MGRRRRSGSGGPKRGKKVTVKVIKRSTGFSGYKLMDELIAAHHTHLAEAKIALAWMYEKKPDADGRLVLGRCKKCSDLDFQMSEHDFVIQLNFEAWNAAGFSEVQMRALLDHELCHAQVAKDTNGEEKKDENGRTVYRIRKHDVEEFQEIVARHGVWKDDLRSFAEAAMRATDKKQPLFNGAANGHAEGNGKSKGRVEGVAAS